MNMKLMNEMKFIPTQARYHPLHGLELKDDISPWLSARTKYSMLEIGVVTLKHPGMPHPNEMVDLPYDITIMYAGDEITLTATKDPTALALALKAHNCEFTISGRDEWLDIPIPHE